MRGRSWGLTSAPASSRRWWPPRTARSSAGGGPPTRSPSPRTGTPRPIPGTGGARPTAAVREALANAATAAEATDGGVDVVAISLAGQMHGVVLADPAGAPCRPAILWLDRRAGAEAARYQDLPRRLTEPLGNQPSPGMAGPILCWLRAHEPASLDRARWALQPKDWLRMRLTGEPATDPTDAFGHPAVRPESQSLGGRPHRGARAPAGQAAARSASPPPSPAT